MEFNDLTKSFFFFKLCERPCGPAHETDDMLRQIVRDGARLDIPDDMRGRIPLHFAISCEFWCRVKTLLHLRSVLAKCYAKERFDQASHRYTRTLPTESEV